MKDPFIWKMIKNYTLNFLDNNLKHKISLQAHDHPLPQPL